MIETLYLADDEGRKASQLLGMSKHRWFFFNHWHDLPPYCNLHVYLLLLYSTVAVLDVLSLEYRWEERNAVPLLIDRIAKLIKNGPIGCSINEGDAFFLSQLIKETPQIVPCLTKCSMKSLTNYRIQTSRIT